MDRKLSQPAIPVVREAPSEEVLKDEPGLRNEHSRKETAPGVGPTPAETFSDQAAAIRAVAGRDAEAVRRDTRESLSLRTILKTQIAMDPSMNEFPEDTREEWQKVIVELMIAAKNAVQQDSIGLFIGKLNQIRDEEAQRPLVQKLLLVPRLAAWLCGKYFTLKDNPFVSTWKIERCSSEDLTATSPTVLAKREGADEPPEQKPLVQVFASLKFSA